MFLVIMSKRTRLIPRALDSTSAFRSLSFVTRRPISRSVRGSSGLSSSFPI